MNIFNSLLFSRRSRRSFLDRPVEKEKIDELIEAAQGIAVALGLASCWVQIRRRKTPADESSSRGRAYREQYGTGYSS